MRPINRPQPTQPDGIQIVKDGQIHSLPYGQDGYSLVADSNSPLDVKWIPPVPLSVDGGTY